MPTESGREVISPNGGGGTTLTEQTKNAFLTRLRSGVPAAVAGRACGIKDQTLYSWMKRGRQAAAKADEGAPLTPYEERLLEFHNDLERVYAEVQVVLAGRIVAASEDEWKAAAWLLARRHRDIWGDQVAITGAGGGPIEVDIVLERAQRYLERTIDLDVADDGHMIGDGDGDGHHPH